MKTVMNCIDRINNKLLYIIDNYEIRFKNLKLYLKEEKIEKIIFIASGSSYNSANATKFFFEKLGFQVECIFPNIFVNYTNNFDSKALYVAISQSGNTKLVYDALKIVKNLGYKNCSITSDLNSPIAKISDISLDMGCGYEEFLYRTLGYSSTVGTCYQLAFALKQIKNELKNEDLENYKYDFKNAINNLPNIKKITLNWYKNHKFSLMRKNQMMFTGTNDLWAVSNEADIKIMEMMPLITRSFELEEFIHGPQNAFDCTTAFFIFGRKGEDENKINSIAKFLKQEIGFCCIIGNLAKDNRDLYFEPKSKHFSVLEYITVAQILAYKLASDNGRDLSRPINAKIKYYINKTL